VFPVDPSEDLLRKDFIDPEGPGRSLMIETFGRTMIKERVLHVSL
jgi:hypothetical protein